MPHGRSAHVAFQGQFDRTLLSHVVFQNFRADLDIDDGVQCVLDTTVIFKFISVDFGHDLHQTLRTDGTFGIRIETGFHCHDRQNQMRIQTQIESRLVRCRQNKFDALWAIRYRLAYPGSHSLLLFEFIQLGVVFGFLRNQRIGLD